VHKTVHAAGPVHTGGIADPTADHASGYVHPATAVTIGTWSAASNHPLPTLAVIVGAELALAPEAAVGVGVIKVRLRMVAVAV
jgi:hypothetical protein